MKRFLICLCAFFCIGAQAQNLSADEKEQTAQQIQQLDSIIKFEPTAENYYYRGYFKYTLGAFKSSLPDFNKTIELDQTSFDSYFGRGNLREKLADYQGAVDDFTKALELNPNSAKAYFNRAYAKSILGSLKSASEDYEKSIEIKPNQANAYLNLGILKQKFGLQDEAILDFDKALELDAQITEAIGSRAISKALARRKDAIDDFNKAIALESNNGEAYYNRAMYFLNYKINGDYCADLRKSMALGFTYAEKTRKEVCK